MFSMDGKKLFNIILGFAVMLFFSLAPVVEPITETGMKVIGVFVGTVLLISLVDNVWPSLLCIPLFALTGVMTIKEAIIGSLGSWVTMFVLMSFIFTYALNEVGFTSRLTAWFMGRPFVNKSPWIFTVSLLSLALFTGLFLDPVPVTAFFLTFASKIFRELGYTERDRYPHMVTMALTFAINIAGGMTPISHPLAIIGLGIFTGATGQNISLLNYMTFGVPIGLAIFLMMLLMLRILFKVDLEAFKNFDIRKITDEVQPMTLREKIIVSTFVCVVILWLMPGLLDILKPGMAISATLTKLGSTFPAIMGVVLLGIIEIDNQPVINIQKVLTNGINWGVIFLVGAAVLLGGAVSNESVGFTAFIVSNIVPIASSLPTILVVLVIVGITSIMTNFSSNVTTVVVMTGVGISVALGISTLNPGAIALATSFTAALAYCIPASFASVAVLYGDAYSNGNTIFKYGIVTMLITIVISTFVGYPLANILLS